MSYSFTQDVQTFRDNLSKLPIEWDGKACVLELKEANYHWKQMEWWAFYFEYKALHLLKSGGCAVPGEMYDRVKFDLKTQINWDLKAKAIKSDAHMVILNDQLAMEQSIKAHGYHGEIIAMCDVEYNDEDRSFQKWHSELKGGLSAYEKKRRQRPNSTSRYRKTRAELVEIIYILFKEGDLEALGNFRQGRNSNDRPRSQKYMLNMERIDEFRHEKQRFSEL